MSKVSDEDSDKTKKEDSGGKDENKGKKREFDPNFNGPIKNRSCTDIICCLLFLVFFAGMVGVTVIGYTRGDPYKLILPTDSKGQICGYDSAVKDKPYLVYFNILTCAQMGPAATISGCPTPQVCRSACPSTYYVYLETRAKAMAGTIPQDHLDKMICKDWVTPLPNAASTATQLDDFIKDETCAAYYVESTSVVNRCVPSIFDTIVDKTQTLSYTSGVETYNLTDDGGTSITGNLLSEGSEYLAKFMSAIQKVELVMKDIIASGYLILVFLGMAMILAFIWIIMMRWITGIMVWVSIFAVEGLLIFGAYWCYTKYYKLKNESVSGEWGVDEAFALNFSYYLQLKETWLAFGCTIATFTTIFTLILLILCSRIRLAIELIKEGSRAIGNMIFTLFWPIIPFLLQLCLIGYMGFSVAYIASMGSSEFYSNSTNTSSDGVNYYLSRAPCTPDASTVGQVCDFVKYGGEQYIIPALVFMLFMFLWVMNFIIALGQMTLAGAFASYYWAYEKPRDIPAFPLTASFYRSIRYHFGTLAFGSLIIAIIQFIRIILEYMDRKLKGSENPVAKFFIKCLKCCFWCLEKFVKFMNRNAYIMTAVYGRNFCSAAKEAFFLLLRNAIRAVVLDKVCDYVLFVSKLLITAAAGTGAFFWFSGGIDFFQEYKPSMNYFLTPVVIVIIGTFIIASTFFSVYTMAVDTLFLCFLEDIEMHDGSKGKPYYMSKNLMKILNKTNKFKDPEKEKNSKATDF